jgi:23S rRNA (uridine2552-2'-O)-methyltransferase
MTSSTKGGAEGGGGRNLAKRLKTARGRTTSQQLWLQRQINDPYVARARREGFRSRAAYKLIEMDDRYKILKPGSRVVDLGAAPGGWCQITVDRIGAPEKGKIVAIDILDMDPIPGVMFSKIDFLDPSAPDQLKEMLGGPADVVFSDMAANTTGHKQTDHLRTMGLVEAAAAFAAEVMAPHGHFLAKVLQGGTEAELLAQLKKDYRVVQHVKPPASRVGSSELYVLAMDFRGGPAA